MFRAISIGFRLLGIGYWHLRADAHMSDVCVELQAPKPTYGCGSHPPRFFKMIEYRPTQLIEIELD
jgi:hypothetical protein